MTWKFSLFWEILLAILCKFIAIKLHNSLEAMQRTLILLCLQEFSYIMDDSMFISEVLCLYQTFTDCVSSQYTFWYVDMSDVTKSYETHLDFAAFFFENFHIFDDYSCLKCWKFTKLLQIVCLINTLTLICQYTRLDCRLCRFFGLLF